MVIKCCVLDCKTGTRNPYGGYYGSDFSLFKAPTATKTRLEWQKAIPSPYNEKTVELKSSHRICEVHFKADEISREKPIYYGLTTEIIEKRPLLIGGAIPSVFPSMKLPI